MKAGIVYPQIELGGDTGAFHGFKRAPNAGVAKQAEYDTREALRRFLHG